MSAGTPRPVAHAGLLIAAAAALQVLEASLPAPAPWFRLGLGNAAVLLALHLWGVRLGVWVGLGKVLLGALLTGRLLGPGLLLSAAGTGTALAGMVLALRLSPPLGLVGVSVVGAQLHALAQLAVAALLLIRNPALWGLAPLLSLLAVVSGVLSGILAASVAGALGEAAVADPEAPGG